MAAGVLAIVVLLGGCGVGEDLPSYSTVKDETHAALQQIVDQLPSDAQAVPRAEQSPYSCADSALLGSGRGYFYTAGWDISLPEGFDVPAFIDQLPDLLGETWETNDSVVAAAGASVALVQNKTSVSVNVIDTSAVDGSNSALNLTGISRCGLDPDG